MCRGDSRRRRRTKAYPWLMLSVAIALTACGGSEGPVGPPGAEGPPGEAGPGTRIVFSGVFGVDALVVVLLPPEAGTLAEPPAATCWVSLDSQLWASAGCLFVVDASGSVGIGTFGDPGWAYRIVVVY